MIDLDKIYQGDSLSTLKAWPNAFVQTCVTSPPYWGLRDYGVKGQMGLEGTPEEFVAKMVELFREVRRVLRDDGTLWLNLGDSYAAGRQGRCGVGNVTRNKPIGKKDQGPQKYRGPTSGLKVKDLVGIPWMVAFALRADGWYLRSDIIWSKPNPMPESVQDRPTKAHEYLFLLTKNEQYYYDSAVIREPAKEASIKRWEQNIDSQAGSLRVPGKTNGAMKAVGGPRKTLPETQQKLGELRDKQRGHSRRHAGFNDRWDEMEREDQVAGGANKRTVWTVATQPFKQAHFATFPPKLIEPCIMAGSPAGGVVLDPFMGAGTTALVASSLNRRFVGIELNPKYIEIAEKRIAHEVAQRKMF